MELSKFLLFVEEYNQNNFQNISSKMDIFNHIGELFYKGMREKYPRKNLPSSETIANALIERENIVTTGVGQGIALPNTKIKGLPEIYLGAYILPGIDWNAIDSQLVTLVMPVIAPKDLPNKETYLKKHLNVMARLSDLLKKGPGKRSREKIDKYLNLSKNKINQKEFSYLLDYSDQFRNF